MITQEELTRMLTELEADRIEKTISKTDSDKFGEAICSFSNDMPGNLLPGYLLVNSSLSI